MDLKFNIKDDIGLDPNVTIKTLKVFEQYDVQKVIGKCKVVKQDSNLIFNIKLRKDFTLKDNDLSLSLSTRLNSLNKVELVSVSLIYKFK